LFLAGRILRFPSSADSTRNPRKPSTPWEIFRVHLGLQADNPSVNTIARTQAIRFSLAARIELSREQFPVAVAEPPEVDYADVFLA